MSLLLTSIQGNKSGFEETIFLKRLTQHLSNMVYPYQRIASLIGQETSWYYWHYYMYYVWLGWGQVILGNWKKCISCIAMDKEHSRGQIDASTFTGMDMGCSF